MDLADLVAHAHVISVVVEGTSWQLEEVIAQVIAEGDLDLCGRLLVSASEISARQLAKGLLEKEAYVPLAVAACLRRQPRRPGEGALGGGGGVARRVFRDIDAEEDAKGVPEEIRADIEEMAKTAEQTRMGAMIRDAAMDRDPIRQYIVDNIAPKMPTSEQAMDAMVAIARASAWEETRRSAALKIANDPISVGRLARSLRTDDIIQISRVALIGAVAQTFAREMGKHFQAYAEKRDLEALNFMAENHPDERFRQRAKEWVAALQQQ